MKVHQELGTISEIDIYDPSFGGKDYEYELTLSDGSKAYQFEDSLEKFPEVEPYWVGTDFSIVRDYNNIGQKLIVYYVVLRETKVVVGLQLPPRPQPWFG